MKPHKITHEDVNNWVATEWFRFAASVGSNTLKRFERSFDGRYRVTDHGSEVYLGHDMTAAIQAYNDAP